MLTDSVNDFNWLYLLLLLPAAIYYVIHTVGYFMPKEAVRHNGRTDQIKTVSLLKIEQHSRHPPVILLIITIVPALILLAFGIWVIYTWVARRLEFQIDPESILLLLLFIGLPLYVIIDHFFIQRKYDKLGRSSVAKEARVNVENDVDTVFDACYRALDSMQASIRIMEKPNLLKASIRNSVMTITIIQIEGSKVRVYIQSDSKWLTVKWDGGANQRNVDSFLRVLGNQ
jgi:hypothetical protein